MKRFNVSYVEVLKDGEVCSSYFQDAVAGKDTASYGAIGGSTDGAGAGAGSTSDSQLPFSKLIREMIVPKVVNVHGNKVTKVSMNLLDGFDSYYTTAPEGVLIVCFTKTDIPKILPIRVLSQLKQLPFDEIESNMELRVHIGEILDKFHEELLNYRNEHMLHPSEGDPLQSTDDEIQDVIQIMNDNIDKFLERQERVSLLVDKTQQLNTTSHSFKRKATRIKDRMWWQRMKNATLLIFAIILCVSALFIFIYIV
ncbi:Nyv1p KNAG_0G02080 [Huiozyma naganishii CBS 8797]|uniref:V-SNARE coiled-coil homology domain-containing protein n=1 Tax=Huiozyma naganishii (strain ATCC MYA-139 / BCRC 22969 / CBS 8797 / KCTC 17520 / NBRC 10181 / NCYC 3082 / Yp74L-3) TaxID=1071383 RepID=J7R8R7_HUIN7|nr:hypothetical protein KNAG_0G02080 [Kazachstania naganishii CBS 8797]CCK71265.1 hypothetical protein KNAG_0G02080 [Kazachstania naganishii CBS 8797]